MASCKRLLQSSTALAVCCLVLLSLFAVQQAHAVSARHRAAYGVLNTASTNTDAVVKRRHFFYMDDSHIQTSVSLRSRLHSAANRKKFSAQREEVEHLLDARIEQRLAQKDVFIACNANPTPGAVLSIRIDGQTSADPLFDGLKFQQCKSVKIQSALEWFAPEKYSEGVVRGYINGQEVSHGEYNVKRHVTNDRLDAAIVYTVGLSKSQLNIIPVQSDDKQPQLIMFNGYTGPKSLSMNAEYEDLPGESDPIDISKQWLRLESIGFTWLLNDGQWGLSQKFALKDDDILICMITGESPNNPQEVAKSEPGKQLTLYFWSYLNNGDLKVAKTYFEIAQNATTTAAPTTVAETTTTATTTTTTTTTSADPPVAHDAAVPFNETTTAAPTTTTTTTVETTTQDFWDKYVTRTPSTKAATEAETQGEHAPVAHSAKKAEGEEDLESSPHPYRKWKRAANAKKYNETDYAADWHNEYAHPVGGGGVHSSAEKLGLSALGGVVCVSLYMILALV